MQFIKLGKMHLCLVLNVGRLVSDVVMLNCGEHLEVEHSGRRGIDTFLFRNQCWLLQMI